VNKRLSSESNRAERQVALSTSKTSSQPRRVRLEEAILPKKRTQELRVTDAQNGRQDPAIKGKDVATSRHAMTNHPSLPTGCDACARHSQPACREYCCASGGDCLVPPPFRGNRAPVHLVRVPCDAVHRGGFPEVCGPVHTALGIAYRSTCKLHCNPGGTSFFLCSDRLPFSRSAPVPDYRAHS